MTLTGRKLEIVELVGRDGLSWAEVADRLGLSIKTVECYVERIKGRTGIDRKPREAMVVAYHLHVRDGPDGSIPAR